MNLPALIKSLNYFTCYTLCNILSWTFAFLNYDFNELMLLSFDGSNKNASAESISVWVKDKLPNAGIETNI